MVAAQEAIIDKKIKAIKANYTQAYDMLWDRKNKMENIRQQAINEKDKITKKKAEEIIARLEAEIEKNRKKKEADIAALEKQRQSLVKALQDKRNRDDKRTQKIIQDYRDSKRPKIEEGPGGSTIITYPDGRVEVQGPPAEE